MSTTYGSPADCRNDRFKWNTWDNIFGNITNTNLRNNYYKQMFCIDQTGVNTNNNYCYKDNW